jgi:hypothetical protein
MKDERKPPLWKAFPVTSQWYHCRITTHLITVNIYTINITNFLHMRVHGRARAGLYMCVCLWCFSLCFQWQDLHSIHVTTAILAWPICWFWADWIAIFTFSFNFHRFKPTSSYKLNFLFVMCIFSWNKLLLTCICKISKSDYQLHDIRPSVRMEQLISHWTYSGETWYLSFFFKILLRKFKFH